MRKRSGGSRSLRVGILIASPQTAIQACKVGLLLVAPALEWVLAGVF
jgi:hypothetical protein